ncbi:MAG: response regulator [Rhodanobacter sp.]|nr:MAG: response regulator [Rhodanobacter sp.]
MTQVCDTITILMAEDDMDDRLLFKEAFNESWAEVALEFVDDGVELMQRLEDLFADRPRRLPDLLLLDLNMPRMDGREALQAIREHSGLKHLPVIIFTTSRAELDVLISYQLGANSYVTKPNRYDELVQLLRSMELYWTETVELPSDRHGDVE